MRTVETSTTVAVDATRALTAFLDPVDLQGWWGVERALVEPREGGVYVLAWGVTTQGFQYVSAGTVGQYLPGCALRIDNYTYLNPARRILGPMRLLVRTEVENDHTRVHVVQDGYQQGADWDWYYEAVLGAWPAALRALRAYLAKEEAT